MKLRLIGTTIHNDVVCLTFDALLQRDMIMNNPPDIRTFYFSKSDYARLPRLVLDAVYDVETRLDKVR